MARTLRLVILATCSIPASSTVDAGFTSVVDGTLVQIMSWYDNEMGYSTRLKDLTEYVAAQL